MSYLKMVDPVASIKVLGEVLDERAKQDEKWGPQNHHSFDRVLQAWDGGCPPERMAGEYEIPSERRAKFMCQHAAANGELTWMHILVEEVAEVCAAHEDRKKLRDELVQVAAVAAAWIEALDRGEGT